MEKYCAKKIVSSKINTKQETAMINLLSTLEGSKLESYFPAAWDLARWEACVGDRPEAILERQDRWHPDFRLRQAEEVSDFNVMMGHELATEIRSCRTEGRRLALILPAGPMGMYRWACYFLQEWEVACDHVTGFSMDEWSDREGRTIEAEDPRSFQTAIEGAFYGPLGEQGVPEEQRFYASRKVLP